MEIIGLTNVPTYRPLPVTSEDCGFCVGLAFLVQLPPSAEFDPTTASQFFESLRGRHSGDVFIEPRHKTWFGQAANKVLTDLKIGRVGADPAIIPVSLRSAALQALT